MISILIDEQRYYNLLEKNRELNIKISELNEEILFLKEENKEYEEVLDKWQNVKEEIKSAYEIRRRLNRKHGKLEMIWHKIEDL
ncbi:TPA: hypothetical protein KRE09_002269 [Clostridioides difficile]|uniref:Uncharacterized protein n=1 Tax=Clostridioides difficile TaxID=1496 RepID=A0A9X8RLJ8_CLODI|nr:hypothetical protein [Clostridioides difficile]AUO78309.1 hypothetical protein LIBA6276_00091 [Clostridioides phage LIBA6276]AUO78479.1 hypothetical protein LIBA2945_00089 [Clostridioides phage LIBA2945]OFU08695.1 hypothetical protein HMPREF3083_03615 [Clostridium sp. HMSC19D07]EGT4145713.1 hypothetical protein [Clostridioides difficile]EGT4176434.1 hypothetical protein [Clostridioides difficile]